MKKLVTNMFLDNFAQNKNVKNGIYFYFQFWISERNPGGSGLVEDFQSKYAENSRTFYELMGAALRSNEYELIDSQLGDFLHTIVSDPTGSLAGDVKGFRDAKNSCERWA